LRLLLNNKLEAIIVNAQNLIVDTQQLQRKVGGVTILKGIDAAVKPGSVIALLGKNGAGKTTLLETFLGFAFPSHGEIKLWGIHATEILDEQKQKIGFVPQQDDLLQTMTGKEIVKLYRGFRKAWNQSLVEKLIIEWMIPMDIRVNRMSVGQRQKLSILLALAHEPQLLILDEPVASLDPIARRQFLQQLVEIAADENRAVIFSTHIVSDVERVANQVWMLRDGVMDYQGDLDTLKESIARITLPRASYINENLSLLPEIIKKREDSLHIQLTIKHWSAELEELLQAKIPDMRVEYLNLEDIFLEMNS
jgi:ABC-2 type transport system ATP-binding protein